MILQRCSSLFQIQIGVCGLCLHAQISLNCLYDIPVYLLDFRDAPLLRGALGLCVVLRMWGLCWFAMLAHHFLVLFIRACLLFFPSSTSLCVKDPTSPHCVPYSPDCLAAHIWVLSAILMWFFWLLLSTELTFAWVPPQLSQHLPDSKIHWGTHSLCKCCQNDIFFFTPCALLYIRLWISLVALLLSDASLQNPSARLELLLDFIVNHLACKRCPQTTRAFPMPSAAPKPWKGRRWELLLFSCLDAAVLGLSGGQVLQFTRVLRSNKEPLPVLLCKLLGALSVGLKVMLIFSQLVRKWMR